MKPNSVLVERRIYHDVENIIRDHHHTIPYIDDDTSIAGLHNIMLFGGWGYAAPVILIAGES